MTVAPTVVRSIHLGPLSILESLCALNVLAFIGMNIIKVKTSVDYVGI